MGEVTIFKILVEKIPPINYESEQMLREIQNYLQISEVTDVRILNGYVVSGVSEDIFEKSKYLIFAEYGQDVIYDDIPVDAQGVMYTTEYLPGQYDQRTDFTAHLLQMLSLGERPQVRAFRTFILGGKISPENVKKMSTPRKPPGNAS